MSLSRQTAYGQIADALRAAILAGEYEPTDENPARNELPGAIELGAKYGVSDKTAARAVQQLIAEGLVVGRPGLRPIVVPRAQRPDRWPMHRRYARARESRGLVFGGDMLGREVRKRTTETGWTPASDTIAPLLRINPGDRVWARARELLIDGRVAELSVSFFPAEVAEGTPLTTPGDFPPGGVVRVLEDAGHPVLRTYNEARSRLATDEELRVFGTDPELQPLANRVVLEITHATYGVEGEPLEAVVSIRPAAGNVIIFETYEGTSGEDEDDDPSGGPDAAATSERTPP
ncbi:MAG TPA: GntR family transcriptional regulator [Actinomycetes bacterium]|nr:GntR family transcriptional regulator [Actinomycetes bacterium]